MGVSWGKEDVAREILDVLIFFLPRQTIHVSLLNFEPVVGRVACVRGVRERGLGGSWVEKTGTWV